MLRETKSVAIQLLNLGLGNACRFFNLGFGARGNKKALINLIYSLYATYNI